ncbi:MAG: choice-of-anchor M domain-containing protein [Verrucomicrobiales bacterium]|nr:choice-of-anchor M domain-containing protein [Verrucomicrobiales bacterium]
MKKFKEPNQQRTKTTCAGLDRTAEVIPSLPAGESERFVAATSDFTVHRRNGVHYSLVLLALLPPVSASALDHRHVQIGYSGGQWDLYAFDFSLGRAPAEEANFPVSSMARTTVPEDTRFKQFLGTAGSPIWILPQIDKPGLLSLGVGSSDIAPGVFRDNTIRLELRRVEGPGHFALYSPAPLGAPTVHMSSWDGVNPAADFIEVPAVSGHLHFNWVFAAAGVYRIGFSASGVLRTNGQLSESPVVDFTFVVAETERPKLLSPRLVSGGFLAFTLQNPTNTVCRLETSVNLREWTAVTHVTNTTTTTELQVSADPNVPIQVLRAVLP